MTRIVALVSAKGGVGKTTLAINIGSVLAQKGYDNLVVDADLGTPNIGIHIGTHSFPVTLHDVLLGKNSLQNAIFYHHPSGLKFVPGHLSLHKQKLLHPRALESLRTLLEGSAPVAFLDCASGVGHTTQSAIKAAHEVIGVTTPDLPAVMNTLKALQLAREEGRIVRGIIVNRVQGVTPELGTSEIEALLEAKVLGTVPDDPHMLEALRIQQPLSIARPGSPAAKAFNNLSHSLLE